MLVHLYVLAQQLAGTGEVANGYALAYLPSTALATPTRASLRAVLLARLSWLAGRT